MCYIRCHLFFYYDNNCAIRGGELKRDKTPESEWALHQIRSDICLKLLIFIKI